MRDARHKFHLQPGKPLGPSARHQEHGHPSPKQRQNPQTDDEVAAAQPPDDLTEIAGIGPKLAERLESEGIRHCSAIAALDRKALHLREFEGHVTKALGSAAAATSQPQFDALVSFTYNVGICIHGHGDIILFGVKIN